jgi:hypothetical protein
MKIRILDSLVGNDPNGGPAFAYGKGAEVDVPEHRAQALVRSGLAVALESQKIERATVQPTTKEVRKK